MTAGTDERLQVALLHHSHDIGGGGENASVGQLARALLDVGVQPTVVTSAPGPTRRFTAGKVPVVRVGRLPEAPLRWRGFTGPLTQAPIGMRVLLRGRFDIAHAFTVPDAWTARQWRRRSGGRVVFTCLETLDRGVVADRRLRLRLLEKALGESDAVLAASDESADALERWMAVTAPVLTPPDGEGHRRLYEALLG